MEHLEHGRDISKKKGEGRQSRIVASTIQSAHTLPSAQAWGVDTAHSLPLLATSPKLEEGDPLFYFLPVRGLFLSYKKSVRLSHSEPWKGIQDPEVGSLTPDSN